MPARRFASIIFVVGIAAALSPTATASPRTAATAAATRSIIVRPVTAGGKPAAHYRIAHTYGQKDDVYCNDATSSPGAVDSDIDYCSPSAAYAIACWKAPRKHTILCLQRFSSHQLVRFRNVHGFTKTAAPSADDLSPLKLVLTNGVTCSIRDGGAWGELNGRPKWFGSYACTHNRVVWRKQSMPHYGVDESMSSWTVHLGPPGGRGRLTVRRVAKAFFVGTKS